MYATQNNLQNSNDTISTYDRPNILLGEWKLVKRVYDSADGIISAYSSKYMYVQFLENGVANWNGLETSYDVFNKSIKIMNADGNCETLEIHITSPDHLAITQHIFSDGGIDSVVTGKYTQHFSRQNLVSSTCRFRAIARMTLFNS